MKVSALIVARNEQKKIVNCLKSLHFVDEIVVILDRSEDDTKKLCKNFTKKIYSGEWILEGDRRNFGISKCTSEWILELDADEIVTHKLSKEIKKNIRIKGFDFYYIKLVNFVQNITIKNGWMACLAPDGKFCLFKKECKKWENKRVHPDYSLFGKKGKQLEGYIEHKMSDNLSDLLSRFNNNTTLHSLDIIFQKKNFSKYFSIRKIFSRFFKSYISRKGYKDKGIGLLISILCAIYPFVSAMKASNQK